MVKKYLKIYQELREKIITNEYPVNSQLPDEISLTKEFHCSRMTVKKALDMLSAEGLIYRKRRQGTFVLARGEQKNKLLIPERDIVGLTRIINDSKVSKLESRVLHFSLEFATEKIAEKLQIAKDDPVYNIKRLRIIDERPYVIEQTYMSTTLIPGITDQVLHESIYQYIEEVLGLHIASANKVLRAAISNEEEQDQLKLLPTEPVFEVEQIAYLDNGVPFEYSISRHRYDLFEFNSFGLRQRS